MLVSVQSTNADEYNKVSVNLDIPWKCKYVKYYVSSLSTLSNILLTNDEDYIEMSNGSTPVQVYFRTPKFSYTIKELQSVLNVMSWFQWEYNQETRTFQIKTTIKTSITSLTHRAALVTGLYNTPLPLELPVNTTYIIKDIPILNHTKLYLVSLQGNAIYSNIGEQQYTPSVIGTINTFTVDKKPLIYDFETEGKPLKIKTFTDSLKYLELSLVDFQYQPILLKSPLFITIKIKPSNSTDINDVITK